MTYCTGCGHELGPGRFCTNCGRPVPSATPAEQDWRADTTERAAHTAPPTTPIAPPPPAPAGAVPTGSPRYPLYADEAAAPTTPPPPYPPPGDWDAGHPATDGRDRRPWGLWVASAVLAVLIGLGTWLVVGGDETATDGPHHAGGSPAGHGGADQPSDLMAQSTVAVPATAPPGQDVDGNPVTYAGRNMLDGVPETCWRMPGDGTGQEITITLPGETTIRRVGLINGYAKSAQEGERQVDWYHANRRVLSVEWVFDDGTAIAQDLDDTTGLQSVDVDDVRTSTITLRLVRVSPPGTGPTRRDYTAISDVSIVGATG